MKIKLPVPTTQDREDLRKMLLKAAAEAPTVGLRSVYLAAAERLDA